MNSGETTIRKGTFVEYLEDQLSEIPGGIREVSRFSDFETTKALVRGEISEIDLLSLVEKKLEEISSKFEKVKGIKDVLPKELNPKGNNCEAFVRMIDNMSK